MTIATITPRGSLERALRRIDDPTARKAVANDLPHPGGTRLQNLVATMRLHGNSPDNLNLELLARHNPWTSADELLAEFRLQENGSRKLPEEISASAPPTIQAEEIEE